MMVSENNISGKKILVVGELLVDIISDENIESLAVASQFSTIQGGSSANLCANLKWLGVEADLVATVGEDNLGIFLINELKAIGLSDRYIHQAPHRQTSVVLVAKNNHRPDFIPYRSADFAIRRVADELIEAADIVHTTAFALSREPARRNIMTALAKAHQMGKSISIDWNFAPSIWQDDDGKEVLKKILKLNPLLKVSVDDLERFVGQSFSVEESVEWLDRLDAAAICLTCGKHGVWYKSNKLSWKYKNAIPVETVRGVTGAGDAFWSGFLSAFIQEKPMDECINKGLEVARLKIEKPYPLYKK
ncbi:carbohydrate kinase family protein [Pedobacter sp. G11]|uniref:carbohydrate kinase family protein n=1 Tax=Pedobacter sp. G11 TaxID=2482728 RepID=UPI000F5DC853|nr:carbohydrate kinase family protein [Pedobacter sp. G11]AZI26483.1 carbohydrate kinase family protein [Pedobacter sp. G11]